MKRQLPIRRAAVLASLAALAACGPDRLVDLRGTDTGPMAGNKGLDTTVVRDTAHRDTTVPPGTGRILIDASRDGGVWWYPQWAQEGNFDPGLPHQGQLLATALRTAGYTVRELPRPYPVTRALLDSFDIVIRASVFGGYSHGEVEAYRAWVAAGGRLLLLADHFKWNALPADSIGNVFGLPFRGVNAGDNTLVLADGDPITQGSGPLQYVAGSALLSYPDSAVILGRLTADGFVDLDANGTKDPGEPAAAAVFGRMRYGAGRIVFCGDTNLWEWLPQPLLNNVLAWLSATG